MYISLNMEASLQRLCQGQSQEFQFNSSGILKLASEKKKSQSFSLSQNYIQERGLVLASGENNKN